MASIPQILVAGIGNIFLGDDAFGSEVARRLLARPHAANVCIIDFGIRGLDLVYALLDGPDAAILIDAVPRPGEPAGTLYVLEPRLNADGESSPPLIEAHSMDPMKVLRTAAAMGARTQRIVIIGCQPASVPSDDDGDMPLGMSEPVAAAVDEAVAMVESLIEKLTDESVSQPFNEPRKEIPQCSP